MRPTQTRHTGTAHMTWHFRAKDGGAFVKLSYVPPIEGKDEAEKTILEDVRQKVQEEGYRPWWMIGPSEIFFVKGKPWLEVRVHLLDGIFERLPEGRRTWTDGPTIVLGSSSRAPRSPKSNVSDPLFSSSTEADVRGQSGT